MTISLSTTLLAALCAFTEPVDFSRDVLPILSDNCFSCHGPDGSSRKANLRLDTREGATADRDKSAAVTPGDLDASALWTRVTNSDSNQIMPPPASHKDRLGPHELTILRTWIEEGAPWAEHWAFVPPIQAELSEAGANPVDDFVSRHLATEGLVASERAQPHVLARRLSFDLTGLPPTSQQSEALAADASDEALSRFVDELLASPHYGERMAMWWLDGARYADTDGFQADAVRSNWPWRDWVIQAFQDGMPFDQFTLEQFAGDLLPDATPEQVLATCFHRNHMHNGEGGRIAEESRVDYVLDRVNTTGTVWLGLTMGCAQCHDHKFDPISQRDYYSLSAYFNSIDESGKAGGGAKPFLKYRSSHAKPFLDVAEEEHRIAKAEMLRYRGQAKAQMTSWLDAQKKRVRDGFTPWTTLSSASLSTAEGSRLQASDDGSVRCLTPSAIQEDYRIRIAPTSLDRITAIQLEVFADPSGSLAFTDDGEFILTNVKLQVTHRDHAGVKDIELNSAISSHVGKGVDAQYGAASGLLDDDPRTGWTTRTKEVADSTRLVVALAEPLVLHNGEELRCILMHRSTMPNAHLRHFRLSATDQPGKAVRSLEPMPLESLAAHVASSSDPLPAALHDKLLDQYLEDDPLWHDHRRRDRRLSAQVKAAKNASGDVSVTVLAERAEPRQTHVLERGVFDNPGERVDRGVPSAVLPRSAETIPTRLELARWLIDRQNPLTARVIVNQIWQLFFGAGLVRTPGDFGLQGEGPTHPLLLDWLAVDFMESGWDIRHLVRRIVHSDTYRQDSRVSPELLERDPKNRWLARGARFRLPSWMIRDAALATSGLLDRTVFGPPVYPHQPEGVWEDLFMGRFRYEPTIGRTRHRRSLYAFWRRNVSPTYLFDTANRRLCDVDVHRTNTPLQALTLLNDQTFLEAARALAIAGLESVGNDPIGIAKFLGSRVLGRELDPNEVLPLIIVHAEARATYKENNALAHAATAPSEQALVPLPAFHDPVDLASAQVVANLLLNLDEALTHE